MLTMLLSALGGRWGNLLATGLAVTLAAAISLAAIQSARLGHAKADLAAARADLKAAKAALAESNTQLASCTLDRRSLRAAVDAQNTAADALRLESEHRAAVLAGALAKAQGVAADAARRASQLQAHRIVGQDVCARFLDVDRAVVAGG